MATITKYPNTIVNDSNLEDHESNWTGLSNIKANDDTDAQCSITNEVIASGSRQDDPTIATVSGSGADWFDPGAAADGSEYYYADVYYGGGHTWSKYLNLRGMSFNIPSTSVTVVTGVKVDVICSGQGYARTMEIALVGASKTSSAKTVSMPTSKGTATLNYSPKSWGMPDTRSEYLNLGIRLRINHNGTNAGVYFVRVTINYQTLRRGKTNGIYATNFGFDLKDNARINSVKLEWEEYLRNTSGGTSNTPTIPGKNITLLKANNGSNVTKTSSISVPTGRTQRTMTFSSSDIPNVKRANIENSGFGVYFNPQTNTSSDSGKMYLDYIRAVVNYTDPTYSLSATTTSGVVVGNQITYTLTLKNTNNCHQGINIPVTVNLPSGLTVASQSGDGTYNTTTKKWNAILDSTRTAKLTLKLNTSSAGTKTITATVDGFSTNILKSTTILPPTYTITSPKTKETVTETQNLTYTVTVGVNTNAVSSVAVNVPVPQNMAYVSASGNGTYNSGTGVWTASFTNRTATMTFTWLALAVGVKNQTISVGSASFTKQITILPANVTVPYYTDHEFPEEILTYIKDGQPYVLSCWSVVSDTVFDYVYPGDKNFTIAVINGGNEYLSNKATQLNTETRISTTFIYNKSEPIKLRIYGQWLEVNPQNAGHEVGGFALYHIEDDRPDLLENEIQLNVATGTDYLENISGFITDAGGTSNISSSTDWSVEGERSLKYTNPGRIDALQILNGSEAILPVQSGDERNVLMEIKGMPVQTNLAQQNVATGTSSAGNTTGWTINALGTTLESITTERLSGFARSLEISIDGSTVDQGARNLSVNIDDSTAKYTVGIWVKAPSNFPGRIIVGEISASDGWVNGSTIYFDGTGDWQLVQATHQFSTGTKISGYVLSRSVIEGGAAFYVGAVGIIKGEKIYGYPNPSTGKLEQKSTLQIVGRNSNFEAIESVSSPFVASYTPQTVNLECIFRNSNTAFMNVKIGQYNIPQATELYIDKIRVREGSLYPKTTPRTNYELPGLFFDNPDLLILDGDYASVSLEPFRTSGKTIFKNLNWSGFEENQEIIIKGLEITGDIAIPEDVILNITLIHGNEEANRSIIVPYTEGSFNVGSATDKWGLNQINLPNLTFVLSLTNSSASDIFTQVKNISIVVYYIYDETAGNPGYRLDGVHSREYNIFLSSGWEKPDGINADLQSFKLNRHDGEIITSSTVVSKEFKIKFQIVANGLNDANQKLKELTGWMTNKRDQNQKPIPKVMIFDWDPDREYNVIMNDAVIPEFEVGRYECTAKFLVPEGVGWTSTKVTGNFGRNNGLIPIRPVLQVLCTGESEIYINESVTRQFLRIQHQFPAGTILLIDTQNRTIFDNDGNDYIHDISFDSYWFKIKEDYDFTGSTGCAIQKVTYKEAV